MLRSDYWNLGKGQHWKKSGFMMGTMVLLLTFVVVGGFGSPAYAAKKGPIKIGFISPLTGSRAQIGADMAFGYKLFLKEVNYTVAGRKIEFINEDAQGKPTVAITKARKLITHDRVNIMAGVFSSSVAYAVVPLAVEANIPFVVTATAGDDITQRKGAPNVIRVCYSGSQVGHVAGDYAYNELGWRRIAILGWEHAFGQETIGAFQRVFEDAGGKVIQRIYVPRNTLDFTPYVASFKRDADGLYAVITGPAMIRFRRALRARGLTEKWKTLTVLAGTDESFLQEMGTLGRGMLGVDAYSPVLDTPENKKFVAKVKKATKREVTTVMMNSYVGADWTARAIRAVKGDVENKEKFIKALRAVEIPDSPKGHLKLEKYGNVVENIYVRRVEKVKGRYQNSVVYTYRNVSQFWKYDPEAYLKAPLYSSKNPPCKYCE